MTTADQMPDRLGPYRLLDRIGEGGMGVVYLGRDPEQRSVAIKVLRSAVAADPNARRRLAREVETMRRVRSPFVAEVLDTDVAGDTPYIVTRYVPGRTLDEVVTQDGPLTGARLARLAGGLAEALAAIHAAGVVHRDLKPGNVMLVNSDPVVIDFGIAQAADSTRLTMTGMFMGTPGYLAPEVIEGSSSSGASDVHSWGATVAFAATGRQPFGSGTFQTIFFRVLEGKPDIAGIPPRLLPFVTAALSAGTSFVAACENGTLPNVCYIDPAFDNEATGTSGDDHPLGDIRLGERFIADAYHALADNGYLDDTVFIVTFDEWGGFYDHVPPPRVIDDTNPANVMHAGDSTTPTDGQLYPNYKQLGFRVPAIVVSNLAPATVIHHGPFEHASTLKLIESTFGLSPLTARDRHARNLRDVLLPEPVPGRYAVRPSSIPTSSDVIGPAISPPSESLVQVLEGTASFDPADICSADSVQSVSPEPVNYPPLPQSFGGNPSMNGTSGMDDLFRNYRGKGL